MQPLCYSVGRHLKDESKNFWFRHGHSIGYFKNHLEYTCKKKSKDKKKSYFTLTFKFESILVTRDTCYFALHYPYTYTSLLIHVNEWRDYDSTRLSVEVDSLTRTKCNLQVPIIQITRKNLNRNKKFIYITSRVHPGESQSSHIVHGLVEELIKSKHDKLNAFLEDFIFIIVPMLNPDGVILGNNRCSLLGEDLNRVWKDPSELQHPVIFSVKELLKVHKSEDSIPYLFIDIHGHSSFKDIFLYGCFSKHSRIKLKSIPWKMEEELEIFKFPDILNSNLEVYSMKNSRFKVEKKKLKTARIVAWHELGILRSYTLESTFCGFTSPINPRECQYPHQVSKRQWQHIGSRIAQCISLLGDEQSLERRNYESSEYDSFNSIPNSNEDQSTESDDSQN